MRYSVLATALSLALGGGVALADEAQQDPTTQQTDTSNMQQPKGTTQAQQPAQPQAQQQAQPQGQQPSAPVAENIQPVELFFQTSSAQLDPNASAELKQLADWARCNPQAAIILSGHADPRGTQAYNLKLSGERAAMVRKQLIQLGVPSDHIVVTVFGENGPKRATYAQDRRVTARGVERPVRASDLAT